MQGFLGFIGSMGFGVYRVATLGDLGFRACVLFVGDLVPNVSGFETRATRALGFRVPYALRPTPYALRLTPYTLRPTPYALRPKLQTLNPTPQTLNPKP